MTDGHIAAHEQSDAEKTTRDALLQAITKQVEVTTNSSITHGNADTLLKLSQAYAALVR